ncbi:MAG TPA: hypothetical protein VGW36_03850, partial [Pyrinomonadaceae bacterium]|nr:hypothetical protein [Pyrinomonadaceae bacterium]
MAGAQTIRANIKVTSLEPAVIHVQLQLPTAPRALSFRNTYAGVIGLGERVSNVVTHSHNIDNVLVKKVAPGEFESVGASRFDYDVNLAEPSRPAQMSHISWLNREHGLLMLADLLPQTATVPGTPTTAQIKIELP